MEKERGKLQNGKRRQAKEEGETKRKTTNLLATHRKEKDGGQINITGLIDRDVCRDFLHRFRKGNFKLIAFEILTSFSFALFLKG